MGGALSHDSCASNPHASRSGAHYGPSESLAAPSPVQISIEGSPTRGPVFTTRDCILSPLPTVNTIGIFWFRRTARCNPSMPVAECA